MPPGGSKGGLYLSTPRLEQATVVGTGDLDIDRMESQRLMVNLGGNGRIRVGRIGAERDFLGVGEPVTIRVIHRIGCQPQSCS